MQVLHAIWNTGRLHLWAESSALPLTVPPRRGRPPKKAKPKAHPFSLPGNVLRDVIVDTFGGTPSAIATGTFLLPSTRKGPLPSPWLILEEDCVSEKATTLSAWNIEMLVFDAHHAFDLLLGLPAHPPHGIAFGGTLGFLIEAAIFSLELIAREQFVPAIKGNAAVWKAVISGDDLERVHTLAEAMPPACRAFAPQDDDGLEAAAQSQSQSPSSTSPPSHSSSLPPSPRDLIMSFIDLTVDAFVRRSIKEASLFPPRRGRRPAVTPLPQQFLTALSSRNSALDAPAEALDAFSDGITGWLSGLKSSAPDVLFRTCFRLDSPPERSNDLGGDEVGVGDEDRNGNEGRDRGRKRRRDANRDYDIWSVHFFLQATDDPSLLIPAETVWKTRSKTLTFLKRKFKNPQEQLLADLGRASQVFPEIEASLEDARPVGFGMSTSQAYAFLRESAPLLEQNGFGVLLPSWWEKPGARIGVKLKIKSPTPAQESGGIGSGHFSVKSIMSYDWEMAIGDQTLSEEEFAHLADLKLPLVQVRGEWVELRPEDIDSAINFFEKKGRAREITLGEAMRLGLSLRGEDGGTGADYPDSRRGLPVVGIEAEGWLDEMLSRFSGAGAEGRGDGAKIMQIAPPKAFNGTLRPYQVKGVSWLAYLSRFGFGACLADDMGLGKCTSADSLILVNGTLQRADEIWGHCAGEAMFDGEGFWAVPTEPLCTNSLNSETGKIVQSRIQKLYRQYVNTRLRKVHLEDGSNVTITYRHRLLTNNGWTNDLHVGDYVCVPAKIIWDGRPEDPDLVKFLAWQIAEGYEPTNQAVLSITQKDTERLEDLRQILLRVCKKYKIKINSPAIRTYAGTTPALVINSREYERFLSDKGYLWGRRSRGKTIPPFIMQSDQDNVRIFLRNYFDAEGSSVESMRSIEISTASPILIQQLSYLLRRFGIWMRISAKKKRATNGSGIYRTYYIGTIGGNSARRFYQEIGFSIPGKQQCLRKICETVNNTNVEGIPASDLVASVVGTTKLPIRHFGMHNTVYDDCSQQFSRASLEKVIHAMDDVISGEAEKRYRELARSKWTSQTLKAYTRLDKQLVSATKTRLQHLLDNEVYYCRIKEIEEVQYDGWVYDFEVEEHHNFIANNILCHNTIELIAFLLHVRDEMGGVGKIPDPTLLICPMSVVGNWQREVERFAPHLRVMIHHGTDRLAGSAFADEAERNDLVISTYSLAHRDCEVLSQVNWQHIVLDEAQNIKNPGAKQTQAIKRLKASQMIALTGTPVENRLSELWSIMEFLNSGYLGSARSFRTNFAIPIEKYRDKGRAEVLRRIIQPFVLRRMKTDPTIIQDLPEKMELKVYHNLTNEQASLYEAVVDEMLDKLDNSEGIERKGLVLATLTRLKQICNHPALFLQDGSALSGRSGKLTRIEEMIDEVLAEGDKALIFTQFAGMGAMLRHHLQERFDCEVLFLHGGTPRKQRDEIVRRFQEDRDGPPLFVLSLKAGGFGLNLTAANHVFHFDRWWNPAVENQATDRAFRIGQERNVFVHKFVCIGTLEERIDQMLEEKEELADAIVGAGEAWLTELSTSELKDIFTLSRDAACGGAGAEVGTERKAGAVTGGAGR
ncbi:MAG: hypothetical protein J7J06_05410 [Methanosarcinales archaeon]|nr:hypothetical protein [Methanosarcinales archaeon]